MSFDTHVYFDGNVSVFTLWRVDKMGRTSRDNDERKFRKKLQF